MRSKTVNRLCSLRFQACPGHLAAYGADFLTPASRRAEQPSHSHEIVGGSREQRTEFCALHPSVSGLAEASDRLHPAKDLLDSLSAPLADGVGLVSSRPRIDRRATRLGRHMRRDPHAPDRLNKLPAVKSLVGANRRSVRLLLQHRHGLLALRRSRRLRDREIHAEAIAVLHQDMPGTGPQEAHRHPFGPSA